MAGVYEGREETWASEVNGTLKLTFSNQLKLWEDDARTIPYPIAGYDVGVLPKDLFVEGDVVSGALLDASITAELTFDSGVVGHDAVKFTVIDVEIERFDGGVVYQGFNTISTKTINSAVFENSIVENKLKIKVINEYELYLGNFN